MFHRLIGKCFIVQIFHRSIVLPSSVFANWLVLAKVPSNEVPPISQEELARVNSQGHRDSFQDFAGRTAVFEYGEKLVQEKRNKTFLFVSVVRWWDGEMVR